MGCRFGYTEKGGEKSMTWVKPEFVEVRMEAEISAYILLLE
jgi:hypothetical protein